ncbi:hypothetical protein [Streptomyces sp. NPDC002078]
MSREPEAYTGQTLCSSGSRSPLRAFLRTETGGAAVLVAAALAALLWANAALSAYTITDGLITAYRRVLNPDKLLRV